MVYCNDDPLLAKELEDCGASAIMPLASPIGSGLGIQNKLNLSMIIKNTGKVPVIVDAGIGTTSRCYYCYGDRCDGVLINSAIANAKKPIFNGKAFKDAVISGRNSYLAGRMEKNYFAIPSSPIKRFNLTFLFSSYPKSSYFFFRFSFFYFSLFLCFFYLFFSLNYFYFYFNIDLIFSIELIIFLIYLKVNFIFRNNKFII